MNNVNTEKAKVNKIATILYTAISVVLLLAYLLELLKGSKTLGLFLIIAALDIIPVIACWVLYLRVNDSDYVKDVMGICYGIFYAVSCFTSPEQSVFVYAIPMVFVVTLFNNFGFSIRIGSGVAIISLLHAFLITLKNYGMAAT